MDQRSVKLVSTLSADQKTLIVIGPPNARIYPPGPAFLHVVTAAGVPSFGHKTIIGTGASPPVDQAAIAKLYASYFEGEGSNVATSVIAAPRA
ncbi:hypothetical protein C8J56DRAFT_1117219 [Mycena floridula]|nr:hypothetical protein C8J56DRAFT_1117219 [Mycena floridula]